jgi:hypothetical protein
MKDVDYIEYVIKKIINLTLQGFIAKNCFGDDYFTNKTNLWILYMFKEKEHNIVW